MRINVILALQLFGLYLYSYRSLKIHTGEIITPPLIFRKEILICSFIFEFPCITSL